MSFLLTCSLLLFQNNEIQDIQEQFRVQFVTLDVAARQKGKIVTDLTQADFEVKENGKAVDITYFDVLDYRTLGELSPAEVEAMTAAASDAPIPEKPMQQIILALDFESVPLDDVVKSFHMLNVFLASLDPAFRYSINLYTMDRGSLTKGFVEDPKLVIEALASYQDRYARYRNRTSNWDADMPLGGDSGGGGRFRSRSNAGSNLLNDANDLGDLEEALRQCSRMGGTQTCRCIGDTIQDFLEEQGLRTDRVIGELEILTYKFKENNDLKTMLFLSPGFALNRMYSVTRLAEMYSNGECGRGSLLGGNLFIQGDFNRVIHACLKNRVIFHTFDVYNTDADHRRLMSAEHSGLASDAMTRVYRDYSYEVAEGLRDLAEQSGGTFTQAHTLKGTMNNVLEDNRYFYVLGYTSPEGKSGKFRKIKLKVKRKGVDLQYRKGYYGS